MVYYVDEFIIGWWDKNNLQLIDNKWKKVCSDLHIPPYGNIVDTCKAMVNIFIYKKYHYYVQVNSIIASLRQKVNNFEVL